MTDDTQSKLAGAVKIKPFTELRDKLAGQRQPVFRTEQYAHPRGWNDALDFVERCLKEIEERAAP